MNQAQQIRKMIADNKGKTFGVTFLKKDGTERTMSCRREVYKHSNGGVAGWSVNEDNIGVYEMKGVSGKEAYRCFNVNRVKSLVISGEKYEFDVDNDE